MTGTETTTVDGLNLLQERSRKIMPAISGLESLAFRDKGFQNRSSLR